MAQATEYICKQGDRLDLIAFAAYGDINAILPNGKDPMGTIIAANPDVPIGVYMEEGQRLYIPVFEDQNLDSSDLPPWLR